MPGVRLDTKEFIRRSKAVHGTKYRYDRVVYQHSQTKVELYCKACRKYFLQTPNSHLVFKRGCQTCGIAKHSKSIVGKNDSKINAKTKEFIRKAIAVHGTAYSYKKTVVRRNSEKVSIQCNRCKKDFLQGTYNHLNGKGCIPCSYIERGQERRKTLDTFISQSRKVHGKDFSYAKTSYTRSNKHVIVTCRKCNGDLKVTPTNHLAGYKCPACSTSKRYSSMAITWMESIAKRERIRIQHAENGGEFRVPGTQFKADGYHKRSNTIYEFYGDAFHGNPAKYKPHQKPGVHSNLTARRLYEKTMAREATLRALGYNLVTMWESDWKELRLTPSISRGDSGAKFSPK